MYNGGKTKYSGKKNKKHVNRNRNISGLTVNSNVSSSRNDKKEVAFKIPEPNDLFESRYGNTEIRYSDYVSTLRNPYSFNNSEKLEVKLGMEVKPI